MIFEVSSAGISPAASAATVTTDPPPACFRKPGPVAERSAPEPPRASASVPELISLAAWVCAGTDASATVTFTRSLAGTSRNVSPMFAPWIRFNARRVPTAAPLFWIVNGSDPAVISDGRVGVGRQVASHQRARQP